MVDLAILTFSKLNFGIGKQSCGQCYKTFSVRNLLILVISQSVFQTRPEKFARDKHSSLLRKSANHGRKIFYNIDTVFVPGKPLQPSLVFAGKAGAYPSEAPFRYSTLGQATGLTYKHQTRLKRLARDKHGANVIKLFLSVIH